MYIMQNKCTALKVSRCLLNCSSYFAVQKILTKLFIQSARRFLSYSRSDQIQVKIKDSHRSHKNYLSENQKHNFLFFKVYVFSLIDTVVHINKNQLLLLLAFFFNIGIDQSQQVLARTSPHACMTICFGLSFFPSYVQYMSTTLFCMIIVGWIFDAVSMVGVIKGMLGYSSIRISVFLDFLPK